MKSVPRNLRSLIALTLIAAPMAHVRIAAAEVIRVTVDQPGTKADTVTSAPDIDTLKEEALAIAEKLRENLGNAAAYKPTSAQINSIAATPADAELLLAYVEKLYQEIPSEGSAAKPGQTEILLRGPDLSELPGGYTSKQAHFREGLQIFGFKYVEPGQDTGMAFDGLIKIDDQWVFIPKAWRAFP